jgi:hypothetical protein
MSLRPIFSRMRSGVAVTPSDACAHSASGGQAFKFGQPGRDNGPLRTAARKDCNLRDERGRIVQRSGVEGKARAFSNDATKYQAAADSTVVAHRGSAACSRGRELSGLPGEAQLSALKSNEGDKARSGRPAAVSAVAMTHQRRYACRLVSNRAAEAPAGEVLPKCAHRLIISALDAARPREWMPAVARLAAVDASSDLCEVVRGVCHHEGCNHHPRLRGQRSLRRQQRGDGSLE